MRVIFDGTTLLKKEHFSTCRHCDSIFIYTLAEVECHTNQIDGTSAKAICPVCSKVIWVRP